MTTPLHDKPEHHKTLDAFKVKSKKYCYFCLSFESHFQVSANKMKWKILVMVQVQRLGL